MEKYKLLVGGEWIKTASAIEVLNPFDHSTIGEVSAAEDVHLTGAVDAAARAFDITRNISTAQRSQILSKIAIGIGMRQDELSRIIAEEAGKPIRGAKTEVSRAMNTFTIAAEECKRFGGELIPLDLISGNEGRWGMTRRFPVGPVLAISPFNFPLNLVAHKVAPALAVGNPVIIKPSSETPITALKLGEIILEAGWPRGALSVVPCRGAAIEKLLSDQRVKKVTFTGSPMVGWRLKELCGKMKITLELGGNAAVIVDDDSSLDYAVNRCVMGAFSYSGQICISIQRILLRDNLYDKFMSRFIAKAKKLKMGNPLDETTEIGPMITVSAAEKAESWVEQAVESGAKMPLGGERRGNMFPPTVLEDVSCDQPAYCEEIFAPVAVISRYDDFDAALAEVNDSKFGLQAGVFTGDLKKAWKAFETLEVGGVMVGDVPTFRIDHMPYGGVKDSGFGREGLKYAMEEMTELRLLTINPGN